MQVRTHTKEELSRKEAQLTVLENLVERYKTAAGASGDESRTIVDEEEVDRELRMVGLRERLKPTNTGTEEGVERLEEEFVEGRTIGWKEVFFGRKSTKLSEEEQESAAKAEWQQGTPCFTYSFLSISSTCEVELSEADLSLSFSSSAYFVFTSPPSTLLVSNRSTQRRLNPLESPIIVKYPKEGLLRFGLDNARDTYLFDFINNDNDDGNGRYTKSAFFGCVYVIFHMIIFLLSIDLSYRLQESRVYGSAVAMGAFKASVDREQSDSGCISDRLCSLSFPQSRTAEQ